MITRDGVGSLTVIAEGPAVGRPEKKAGVENRVAEAGESSGRGASAKDWLDGAVGGSDGIVGEAEGFGCGTGKSEIVKDEDSSGFRNPVVAV